MEDTIAKIIDYENEIREDLDKLLSLKKEINDTIEKIDEVEYRIVLQKRYIEMCPWEDIAMDIDKKVRWVQMLHGRALDRVQEIALPHFSMSGVFNAKTGAVPSVKVSWYRKAMENGMILDRPTIFGAAGGRLLAGGEAGDEAVVGVDSLRNMIQEAVAGQTAALAGAISADTGDIVIPVYLGGTLLDEVVVNAQNRQNLRSGGR